MSNGKTMMHNNHHILWTATLLTLPEVLWKRLEALGYKVLITDGDVPVQMDALSPRLWVGQIHGESGLDLTHIRDILSKRPNMPIIIKSDQPHIDEAIEAIKLGVWEYIADNPPLEKLWAILERALEKSGAVPCVSPSQSVKAIKGIDDPIARHPSMCKVMELARKIAPSRSTVLIKGETGVGKEIIARYIHRHSDRNSGPFIAVNCAALPENLLESELFGHEKGAFTGAIMRKKGKFELANRGTLLLDEISETAVSIQAKLLRVLQEREIDRVGGQSAVPVDVRVIATTNRDLEAEIQNGRFRLDLFYRLNVVPLTLPPLRNRVEDMEPLARFFLQNYCTLNKRPLKVLSPNALEFLKNRPWSGNVREFENVMERISLLVDGDRVQARDLEFFCGPEDATRPPFSETYDVIPLKEMEKKMIFQALNNHNGNRTHAAKVLGISVRTLRNKLHEYHDFFEDEEALANG
jgi:two-component system response regulator FlrC